MKKIIIFMGIIVIIVCTVFYMYMNYKAKYRMASEQNKLFDIYIKEEMNGSTIATLINKAIDYNTKNKVEKDNKGNYIDNKKDSININIEFIDNNSVYTMERIYNTGINKFVEYYSNIKFKCVDIKYHESTKKIKYLYFKQVSD